MLLLLLLQKRRQQAHLCTLLLQRYRQTRLLHPQSHLLIHFVSPLQCYCCCCQQPSQLL
jgi:hypothetical protein